MLTALHLIAAAVVVFRCICVASSLNFRDWEGHPWQFIAIALGHALMAAGALALTLGKHYAGFLLLIGVALLILFDRRKSMR